MLYDVKLLSTKKKKNVIEEEMLNWLRNSKILEKI